jgi:hypothetical protein
MKKSLLATILMLLPGALNIANAADKNYSLPISDATAAVYLEVDIHRGDITIEGYQGNSIEVTTNVDEIDDSGLAKVNRIREVVTVNKVDASGLAKTTRSTEGLKSIKNNAIELVIEQKNNTVEISSSNIHKSISLHIKVPMRTNLELELHRGKGIHIENISGKIEVETHKGEIVATAITGPIVAESHSSDIVIAFDSFSKGNPSSLTTHSGNIDITVNPQVAANIMVQSHKGEIFSGLANEFVESVEEKHKNAAGKHKIVIGGVMSAEVNGGGQDLRLVTYNGNLYIRNK